MQYVGLAMQTRTTQRNAICFCFLLRSAVEMWQLLQQAYGDELAVKRRTVYKYEWFKKLKEGRTPTKLILHGGHLFSYTTEINVNKVAAIVKEDGTLTVRDITAVMGIGRINF